MIDFTVHLPLPQLSFGFYGRRKECREIRDGFLFRNQRVIVVHGLGGVGKTALATHAASRLKKNFRGVYAFDCSTAAITPETIILKLHRYLEMQKVSALQPLIHQQLPPAVAANHLAQVLTQWPLLIVLDNFETHLAHAKDGVHEIANANLAVFLKTLLKTVAQGD